MKYFPVGLKDEIKIKDIVTVHYFEYTKNYKFPGESHNFWECVYIENGSICVTADGRVHNLTEGDITIDGISVKDITLKSLRDHIGVVQQDVYLFSGTVRENITYGSPDATDEEIIEAAKNAGAHEFIMSLPDGYDTYVGERGLKLSGGQKQRVSIARLFLKNPPILILDEATSALDNESELIVQKSLERLAKNRTTFVIAHRLTTIQNAEKILVLTEDGIAESGTHEELLTQKGIYEKLYHMHM